MRPFALGIAVGLAAAGLVCLVVAGVGPAAAQFAPPPPVPPQPPDAVQPPLVPPPVNPPGSYQLAVDDSGQGLFLLDTRSGEVYLAIARGRNDLFGFWGNPPWVWEKRIPGPPR